MLKPASDTPVTGGLLLAKIFEEAGLPPGVLSVIIGPGSEIGDAFVTHPMPRVISFTGSTPVGRHIAELAARAHAMKLTPTQVERTLSQFEAQAIPDDHPAVPQLNELFGEHTFFVDQQRT